MPSPVGIGGEGGQPDINAQVSRPSYPFMLGTYNFADAQQASEATRAQVFSDVDSAYVQVESNITLLQPYKAKYRDQATRVRDTITYSYQHGGASLMDFLNAQSDYRTVQLAYLQLIGSYLTAAGQLNLAVGREVIQ